MPFRNRTTSAINSSLVQFWMSSSIGMITPSRRVGSRHLRETMSHRRIDFFVRRQIQTPINLFLASPLWVKGGHVQCTSRMSAKGQLADIVTSLTFRTFCAGNYNSGDPWLQQPETRSEAKRVECLKQIVAALLEMRPTLIVDWNDHGVGKSLRGFDGIVGVHRKMKGATRLRRARKQ